MRWSYVLLVLAALTAGPSMAGDALSWEPGKRGCSARFGHTASWASARKSMIVFGGQHRIGNGYVFYNDLWEYLPGSDTWRELKATGDGPPERAYHAAAWDDRKKALWVFGGTAVGFAPKGDLWRFDSETRRWSAVKPRSASAPPARVGGALFLDAKRGRLVLFGGIKTLQPASNLADLWYFDIKEQKWEQGRSSRWPGRWLCAVAHTPRGGMALAHGGLDGAFEATNETWIHDVQKGAWKRVPAGHEFTDAHTAVWDSDRAEVLVYGGARGPLLGGTAKSGFAVLAAFGLKKQTWRKLEVDGKGPGPRAYHSLVLVPESRTLVLFGGVRNQINSAEHEPLVWKLRLPR